MDIVVRLERDRIYNLRSKPKNLPLQKLEKKNFFGRTLIRPFLIPCCSKLNFIIQDLEENRNRIDGELVFSLGKIESCRTDCELPQLIFSTNPNDTPTNCVYKNKGVKIFGNNLTKIGFSIRQFHRLPEKNKTLLMQNEKFFNCNCITSILVAGVINGKEVIKSIYFTLTNEDHKIVETYTAKLQTSGHLSVSVGFRLNHIGIDSLSDSFELRHKKFSGYKVKPHTFPCYKSRIKDRHCIIGKCGAKAYLQCKNVIRSRQYFSIFLNSLQQKKRKDDNKFALIHTSSESDSDCSSDFSTDLSDY
jgi:hypothetical protein